MHYFSVNGSLLNVESGDNEQKSNCIPFLTTKKIISELFVKNTSSLFVSY